MDELVDIVDGDCVALSSVLKTEAHKKGLLHRTVIAEVRDSKGNWLLVQQSPDRQDAGQFVSPVGGHVKAGETDEEALLRETLEEIGLTKFDYEHIGKFIFERHVIGRHENHYFVVYRIITDDDLVLGDEAVAYRSFSEDALRAAIQETPALFGDAFYALLKQFYPHLLQKS
jgi:isopentenyl-diphosphate delta-isomerase